MSEITFADFFKKMESAMQSELPFVAYRLPNSLVIKGFVQQTDTLFSTKNYNEEGFVFAPFDDAKKSIVFPLQHCNTYSCKSEFIDEVYEGEILFEIDENTKQEHVTLVEKAINFLSETCAKKVVLSRCQEVSVTKFEVFKTFTKLLTVYLNAMAYCWYHPKIGLWLGATPERLLSVEKTAFQTMALAGTQTYDGTMEVEWGEKELIEQQHVTDYIKTNLKEVTDTLQIGNVSTVKAGSLLHLCTHIEGKLSEKLSLKKLIDALHPTPAVCGLPKESAKEFILKNEGYDRSFYTGFLGELSIENRSNLFVNLRCMQVKDTICYIYVGGGITSASVPEKEWEETVAKSKVMLRVLK